jgi:hypothetical protein
MAGITQQFLNDLGVQMDDQTFQAFSEHFNETLYDRVNTRIIHSLNDDQTHQLAMLSQSNSDQVWPWLQTNIPNLGDIVEIEITGIMTDLANSHKQL